MAGRQSVWRTGMAVCALTLLGALGIIGASAAKTEEADASSVTQWNLIAANTLTGLPQPAGGAAPSSQISMGMVQGAVYDAVNAITPKHHRPYLLKMRGRAMDGSDRLSGCRTARRDTGIRWLQTGRRFKTPLPGWGASSRF
jgi:hypothetical protein